MGEPERQLVGAAQQEALRGRHRDGGRHEQEDDHEHQHGEALLLDPLAALHVVDAAEGGVERAPERRPEPHARHQRDDAEASRVVPDVEQEAVDGRLGGAREQAAEVDEHTLLEAVALEDIPEDEEREQREREEREQEVVGHHAREPGGVVLVRLPIERLDVPQRPAHAGDDPTPVGVRPPRR